MLTRLPTNWTQWLGAVLGSVLVGLAGVLPLAVVPASKVGGGAVSEDSLKYLLGFAAGGLLGDVFLHLLPETYQHVRSSPILTSNYNVHNVWRRCLKHLIIYGHGLINAVYALQLIFGVPIPIYRSY